jgi:hypothetical protein
MVFLVMVERQSASCARRGVDRTFVSLRYPRANAPMPSINAVSAIRWASKRSPLRKKTARPRGPNHRRRDRCCAGALSRISTPSYAQLIEPIHRRAIGRWQPFARLYTDAARATLNPWVERFGYPLVA